MAAHAWEDHMKTMARIALAALLSTGAARAQDACRADAEKLCAGIRPGEGRILACLHGSQAQLSPACKQQVGTVGAKVKEIGAACGDDVLQFCPNVKTGGGRILKCLEANAASLSQTCQAVVQKAEEKSAEFKKSCGEDVKKFCASVPKGQGRILKCLQSKQAELAPACQALLKPLWATGEAPAAAPAAAAPAAAPAPAPAAPPAAAPAATPAAAPPAADAPKK
jgi:pyruvate/2-oxoglutarate dehydrogenase complex dihydrolipoamide acyltransferase (E2) component